MIIILDNEALLPGRRLSIINKIKSGRNSKVYKVANNDNEYFCLKIYKEICKADTRKRALTEFKFLKYLQDNEIQNTPKYIVGSTKERWSLLSWIPGVQPKVLKNKEIQDIAKFILKINKHKKGKGLDFYASEALTSIDTLSNSINGRFRRITQMQPHTKAEEEMKKWLETEFKTYADKKMNQLNSKAKELHWKITEEELIHSQSDVGIHNSIKKEEELYFVDFEYAGIDDVSKVISDWVNHPEYRFNKEQETLLLESIKPIESKIGIKWKSRYYDIREIIQIKWIMIMLNCFGDGRENEEYYEKVVEYFKKSRELTAQEV